ncbi:radical SAM protein [Paenibacillus tuaregi]|uniref:radical SAM protein n=1 Tax=Paenibacillus tuaregi TaxID=1816681 RepID=UPI0009ED3716|nr:radical SAM protein [Paenibacillus tuaregi]
MNSYIPKNEVKVMSSLFKTHDEMTRLFTLKLHNKLDRMGKLFTTDLNNYFYDTGTGKVLVLDDDSFKIMNALFNLKDMLSVEQMVMEEIVSRDKIIDFENTVRAEHLFLAPELDRLYSYDHYEGLKDRINEGLEQIILELTGRCNLRCGYCIYNDDCDLNRNFHQDDMSLEIAKAAVEYTAKHSREEVAVTFYGGEPLLKFDLLKWAIEYSRQIMQDKKLTFSLTTNMTLVTKEIAEYFASVPNLSLVCSMDGPEYVQDSYRKYANGKGSFSRAFQGLKLLAEAFSASQNVLSINAVFAPPYTYDKLNDINSFFADLDFLPKHTEITIGYASKGSVEEDEYITELHQNPKYSHNNENIVSPLWIWMKKQVESHSAIRSDKNNVYSSSIERTLNRVENRFLTDEPRNIFPFNGCCVPGARRLYVSTTGELFVCERVGNSPSIGHVFTGINFDNIQKYYVQDYSDGSIEQCKNCWAVRLCNTCYAANFTQEGFDSKNKNMKCEALRHSLLSELALYHSIREITPEKLNFLEDIEVY